MLELSEFLPLCSITGIGSMPHTNPEEAVECIFRNADIPFWPQLPKRSFLEGMIAQFSSSIPCVKIDLLNQKVKLVTINKNNELEDFFAWSSKAEDKDFALKHESAKGFYVFKERVKDKNLKHLKGQITGPLTLTTTVFDEEGKPLLSDKELCETALYVLCRITQWQIKELKKNCHIPLIFVDEPVMAGYGSSSYIYLTENIVVEMLSPIFETIRNSGAIPGVHVCGNTDWHLLMNSGASIISFDTYQYGKRFILYHETIKNFLDKGGAIAWGIAPSTEIIKNESSENLFALLKEHLVTLISKGIERELLLYKSLITPVCGLSNLSTKEAEEAFKICSQIKDKILSEPTI